MAKRSKRRPVRQNKDQAGCMWGLISIFDFRHGRFTRKMLPDRRHGTKNTVGAAYITSKLNILTNSDELCQTSENVEKSDKQISDVVKTSVKELMEEEMFTEQGSKKQVNSAEVELFDSKSHNHTNKTFKKSCDFHENSDIQVSAQRTSSYLDLEGIMEELLLTHQKSDGLDMHSNQTYSVVQEKLSAAVEVLIKEKFTNGEILTENGKILNSKDFIDALQILSSNKELFLKLLQDPNSLLLKHIRGSADAQLEEDQKTNKSMARSNLLENEPSNSRPEELITHKHRNFFRRRSKSQESNPLKENNKSQLSSTIVILKPGHPDDGINVSTYEKMENEVQSGRNVSQFSFMEIKRKLKHAMGKERHSVDSEKGIVEGTVEWSSPNRNHFYTERFAKFSDGFKKGDRVSNLRDRERKIMENEINGDSKQRVSNIYIEAKKHLSEMLSNGNEDAELMIGSLPKTLGRIISLPEYNYSPSESPRKEERGFVTAQMRFCPQMVKESQPCISDDNPDEKVHSDDVTKERESSMREETGSEGVVEIIKSPDIENQEDRKILDDLCDPCSSLDINNVVNDEIAAEVFDEKRSSHHLEVVLPEENESSSSPPASPISSSFASKTEELESAIDRNGRPSPISVLEPLFSEGDISPASNSSRPVGTEIQPLHIQFVEIVSPATNQEICIGTFMENEESAFEYVEAVLLASDLKWDEFLTRWLSSDQILDPSLFDEVELFSNRSCHDQRLLFDCTNEILKAVCDSYFDKQNIRPVPLGMKLINEVWEGIESLLLQNPYPRSLDQLIRKDLGKFGTWMDLRLDTEAIVCEMEESILEGLVDDTFLIFSE